MPSSPAQRMPPPNADLPADPAQARGLGLLVQGRQYAARCQRPHWDFAVDLYELWAAGLTSADLRLLLLQGHVASATEVRSSASGRRRFRRHHGLRFTASTCFVLTDAGAAHAERVLGFVAEWGSAGYGSPGPVGLTPAERPRWEAATRTLYVGGCVVKRLRQPASVQELILASFEEEGWPERLDDPLPPRPELDPRARLQDAIRNLNRALACPVLRFGGDGTGTGILWRRTC